MIYRYYNTLMYPNALERASRDGLDYLIKSAEEFGTIGRISTKIDDNGKYKDIKIEFV